MEPDAKRARTNSYDYSSPHHQHSPPHHQQQPPHPPPSQYQGRAHHPPPPPPPPPPPQQHSHPHQDPPGPKYQTPHTPTGAAPPHAHGQAAPPPTQQDRHMHDPSSHGYAGHHPGYNSIPRHGDPYSSHTPTTPTVASEHHHHQPPSLPPSAHPHHSQAYPPQHSHLPPPADHDTRREHMEPSPYHHPPQHPHEQGPNGAHLHAPPPAHMGASPNVPPPGPGYAHIPPNSAGPHQPPPPYENGYTYAQNMQNLQPNLPRRKAIRAAQACDNCRQKKAKCDELRPSCGNCIQTQATCNYRDVPPPKQDKSLSILTDQVNANKQEMESMHSTILGEMKNLKHEILTELRSAIGLGHSVDVSTPALMPQRQMSSGPGGYGKQTTPKDYNYYQRANKYYDENYKTQPPTPSHKVVVDETSSMDVLQGELAIPVEHTTAAHKLLTEWPTIKPFYESITERTYVARDEQHRPMLDLFGEKVPAAKGPPTPDGIDVPSRDYIQPPTQPAGYSKLKDSFVTSPHVVFSLSDIHRVPPGPGGLFADGSLCTDTSTCWRLLASYLKNMHVFHPLLNKDYITGLVEQFISRYSPTPFFANPHRGNSNDNSSKLKTEPFNEFNTGSKRKRLSNDEVEFSNDRNEDFREGATRRVIIERTIENALVLLILALGKICEHGGPLPPALDDEERLKRTGYNWALPDPATPASMNDEGSASSPNSRNGMGSPTRWNAHNSNQEANKGAVSELQEIAAAREKALYTNSNMERIPGLAYFAYATAFLGDMNAGSELINVHAFLLAGIYIGQMARVFESWSWINRACTMCEVLWKRYESADESDVDLDPIKMAFWSCLQLESDILAELDLPHSGISRLEDTVPLPKGPQKSTDPELETLIMYYSAQVHLRKVLNRAHSALYNSGNNKMRHKGWSILNSNDLALQLDRWRKLLPPQLQWQDDDKPPEDINAARLRAKYWGAQYIIHRPFLHKVVSGFIIGEDVNGGSHSSSPAGPTEMHHSDSYSGRGEADSEISLDLHSQNVKEKKKLFESCRKCIVAARASTVAFDNVKTMPKRLVVTNIFGTAQAQFGNMLVLSATNRSRLHNWLVPTHQLLELLHRTIAFLNYLAPISPTMQTNVRILQNIKRIVSEDQQAIQLPGPSSSF